MSGETWRLIEWFKENRGRSQTRLAINSNLGMDNSRTQEFLDSVAGIQHLELYTSMEATTAAAEYIRDGLDYRQWLLNMDAVLSSDSIRAVHVMATINALCLPTLPDLLDTLLELKREYSRERLSFTLNILRFPSFQSPLVLSDFHRTEYMRNLQEWLTINRSSPLLHEHEINHLQRLIDYLDVVRTPHSDAFDMPKLHNDFKQFYTQYDLRRDKTFAETFPDLADWYQEL